MSFLVVKRYQRTPQIVEPPTRTTELVEALDEVARVLKGERWLLAGGLVIALTLKEFYREHYDLDLAVQKKNFLSVCRAMQKAGYKLYTRKIMKHGDFGYTLFLQIPIIKQFLFLRPRRLCFIRSDDQNISAYLHCIDVYLYQQSDADFVALDGNRKLPGLGPAKGAEYRTLSGSIISCLSLNYVRRYTEPRGGIKHQVDKAALNEGIEAAKSLVLQEYSI